jgi:uncharacterized membrane protein YfcA
VTSTWTLVAAGLAVGSVYGVFGVGSAFATPVLSMLGVPGIAAVVGPLPALLPGSAAGAWSYARGGKVDWRVAGTTLAAGLPAAVLGAVASRRVGGPVLLALSGTVLLVVGLRVLRPGTVTPSPRALARRHSRSFLLPMAALIGAASGLLANGGGFLLVPMFLLALGFGMHEAAGTSMVVAAALTVPTLVTHALIGDIDWQVAGAFAVGLVPGTAIGGRIGQLLPTERLRSAFGVLLVGFALWFLVRRVLASG